MNQCKKLIYAAGIIGFELFIVVVSPLLVVARILYTLLNWERMSVWTGAPILTLSRKAASERLLGVRAISIVRQSYYITNDFDFDILRAARGNAIGAFLLTYITFIWICIAAKRVHTFADGGLLPSLKRREFSLVEMAMYKLLRIRQFVWVYGADVRTRSKTVALGEPNCCTNCTEINVACICDQAKADTNMRRLSRTAIAIFSMGDMIEYTRGSYNQLYFWPLDLAADSSARYIPVYPVSDRALNLRVVHAPNHRAFKGTLYLETAVKKLREEGVKIELIMVEKIPNAQALTIYRSADVIFDQCMIGFHGYFAIEAMALGKPVMCFIRKPEDYLLAPDECPIINTHVTTLMEDLRYLAHEGRSTLPEIGRRGREYVARYYTEQAFSQRLAIAYREYGVTA